MVGCVVFVPRSACVLVDPSLQVLCSAALFFWIKNCLRTESVHFLLKTIHPCVPLAGFMILQHRVSPRDDRKRVGLLPRWDAGWDLVQCLQ